MKIINIFILLLIGAFLCAAPGDPCRITRNVTLPSGGIGMVLENGMVYMLIDPARGGACQKYEDKLSKTGFAVDSVDRIFSDRVLQLRPHVLTELPFGTKILENTPEMVKVEFSRSNIPGLQFVTFKRTLTLRRNSGSVEVNISIENEPEAIASIVVTPNFRHGLGVPGKSTAFFAPTAYKVDKRFNNKSDVGSIYFRDAPAGYAAVSDNRGNGLGFEFDYRYLDNIFQWHAGIDRSVLEWTFVPVNIPSGKSFDSTYRINTFRGLDNVLAVKGGISGNYAGGKIVLSPAVSGNYALNVNGKKIRDIRLDAGKNFSMPLPSSARGGDSATVTLTQNGKSCFRMFIPLKKGVKAPPECGKVPPAESKVKELKLNVKAFPTPHIPWANPHVKGRMKLLVLCDYQHQREVVELAQRLDCDFDVIRISHISSQMKWGMVELFGSFSFKDANSALRQSLRKKFDCIIISGNLFRYIEKDNFQRIRKQLGEGAGLVMINPLNVPAEMSDLLLMDTAGYNRQQPLKGEWIPGNNPIAAGFDPGLSTPGFHYSSQLLPGAENLIASVNGPVFAYGVRNGIKVVQTAYFSHGALLPVLPLHLPIPEFNTVDYHFIPLIKSILAVSNRLPESVVKCRLDKDKAVFEISNVKKAMKLNFNIRSVISGGVKRYAHSVKPAAGIVRVEIPVQTRPGMNIAEYILSLDGKSVDFGAAVRNEKQQPMIFEISADKKLYRAKDVIKGKLRLSAPADQITVELHDSEGRLISDGIAGKDGTFSLPVTEASARLMTVTARAFRNGQLQDVRKLDLHVIFTPRVPDYALSGSEHEWMWNHNRKLRPYFFKRLRQDVGYDVMRLWTRLSPSRGGAAYEDYLRYGFDLNLMVAPQQSLRSNFVSAFQKPFNETGDKKYLCRKPCLHDPKVIAANNQAIRVQHERLKRYSPAQYSTGDEQGLTKFGRPLDFCFSKHSLAAFRKYLKKIYPSLKALNTQWGSSFDSWDKVMPMTLGEVTKFAAKSRNYSPWMDFRTFMDISFSSYYTDCAKLLRKLGSTLDLDLSGVDAGNAYSGMNWYRISREVTQVAPYLGRILEQARSFGPDRVIPWNAGYDYAGSKVFYQVWHDAFMFRKGGSQFYATRNMLFPDYTIQPGTMDWINATRDLHRGLGTLRATLDEETPEVLLHSSFPSMLLATAMKKSKNYFASTSSWISLLVDMHFNFRLVDSQEVENGFLKKSGARVLIMPLSRALSGKEEKMIREFVRDGGIVVADRLPAVADEHGKLHSGGSRMNDIFGLTRQDNENRRLAKIELYGKKYSRWIGNGAKGEKNVFIENRFGKGKGVFINFLPNGYDASCAVAERQEELAMLRKKLTALFGGRRLASYSASVKGGLPAGARIFSYRQKGRSDALFIGLVRKHSSGGKSEISLKFKRPGFVYDMRKGSVSQKKLDSYKVTLAPGEAAFLAVLENKIPEIRLTASNRVVQGGIFRWRAEIPESELSHPLEVTVTGPDGIKRHLYSKIASAHEGSLSGSFRIALNDTPGRWQMKVRNAISNFTVVHKFHVMPRKR